MLVQWSYQPHLERRIPDNIRETAGRGEKTEVKKASDDNVVDMFAPDLQFGNWH